MRIAVRTLPKQGDRQPRSQEETGNGGIGTQRGGIAERRIGAIADVADVVAEVGADLTILGTHEYGTVHTHLLGTTTDKLLTKTSVPVLTLKL